MYEQVLVACLLYMAGIFFPLRGLVFAVVAALSWYSQGDLKQLSIMLFDTAVEDYFSAKNTRRRKEVAIMVAQWFSCLSSLLLVTG